MFRSRCYLLLFACWAGYAQVRNYTPVELPKLEKFDVSLIDKSKNACTDLFQHACSKWIAAHPIPADMPATSVVRASSPPIAAGIGERRRGSMPTAAPSNTIQ
jgi:hypothetical protein